MPSDIDEPSAVRNSNLNKDTFKIPPIPKQKRTRQEPQEEQQHQEEEVAYDSGLHTISDNNSSVGHRQEVSSTVVDVVEVEMQEPEVTTSEPLPQGSQPAAELSRRSSNRFEWIHNLMNSNKENLLFYVSEFDELATSEDIRFTELDGVEFASYQGEKFKDCGYMQVHEGVTKPQAKAKCYDLVRKFTFTFL